MKLGLISSGACTAIAISCLAALSVGCSAGVSPQSANTHPVSAATLAVAVPDTVGTTELMSAELTAAPKVGKAYRGLLTTDDDQAAPARTNALAAPKDDVQSDCPRRGGHFGSAK